MSSVSAHTGIGYHIGAELPDACFTWLDSKGDLIKFASGYTFTVTIGRTASTPLVTKTTGITGADTDPNVTVAWSVGQFDNLPAGPYVLQIRARRTADSKDRVLECRFVVKPAN